MPGGVRLCSRRGSRGTLSHTALLWFAAWPGGTCVSRQQPSLAGGHQAGYGGAAMPAFLERPFGSPPICASAFPE